MKVLINLNPTAKGNQGLSAMTRLILCIHKTACCAFSMKMFVTVINWVYSDKSKHLSVKI